MRRDFWSAVLSTSTVTPTLARSSATTLWNRAHCSLWAPGGVSHRICQSPCTDFTAPCEKAGEGDAAMTNAARHAVPGTRQHWTSAARNVARNVARYLRPNPVSVETAVAAESCKTAALCRGPFMVPFSDLRRPARDWRRGGGLIQVLPSPAPRLVKHRERSQWLPKSSHQPRCEYSGIVVDGVLGIPAAIRPPSRNSPAAVCAAAERRFRIFMRSSWSRLAVCGRHPRS